MYDSFSEDYDRFVNWQSRLAFELPFIEKLVAQIPRRGIPPRILDAACGTGMHAIALAQRGYSVSAADLFPEMVAKSEENAAAAGISINIKVAGFGELTPAFGTSEFDLLLCLGNSLPHLLSIEELHLAVSDFASCLQPGGRLLLQNRNFHAVMSKRERWMDPQTHREGNEEWLFQRFYDFEENGLIRFNIVTLKRSGSADWGSSITSTYLRPLLQAELVDVLKANGFADITSFGGMGGEPYDPDTSANLVLTAFKSS